MIEKIDQFLAELMKCGDLNKAKEAANVTEEDMKKWNKEHRFFLYAIEIAYIRYAENERNRFYKASTGWK